MSDAVTRYRALPREAGMEAAIREGVAHRGGRVWSVRDSRGLAVADMPDLLIVVPETEHYPATIALIELKSQRRKVTPGQAHALELLSRCTRIVTGVCRPIPRDGEIGYDALLHRLGITEDAR